MTEREWLACGSGRQLVEFIRLSRAHRRKTTRRKLRLFGCACVRRIWPLLDTQFREAVILAERFADRLIDSRRRQQAYDDASKAIRDWQRSPEPWAGYAARATLSLLTEGAHGAAYSAANEAEWAHAWSEHPHSLRGVGELQQRASDSEKLAQAFLVRHIFGNPFRPAPAPESWPAAVTQLADAIYNGEGCGFALHDALLDAGHPDLAEHFRDEQAHPKGCWVVDLLLGKG